MRRSGLIRRRTDSRMNAWRRRVRERDRVCQMCGKGSGFDHDLEAAHIFSRQAHPALKYVEEGGLLLGRSCHRKFDANRRASLLWVDERWPDRTARLLEIERDQARLLTMLLHREAVSP